MIKNLIEAALNGPKKVVNDVIAQIITDGEHFTVEGENLRKRFSLKSIQVPPKLDSSADGHWLRG